MAPPGYEAWCSEPLLRLPGCYHPIAAGQDPGGSRLSRADLGLPEDALVVGLQQRQNRVRPPFIDRLAQTVARHPRVHLWLRVASEHRARAIGYLADCGLPAERVHFSGFYADRADYLQALRLIDLFVDTHPYGGHSTTGEVRPRPSGGGGGRQLHPFPGRRQHADRARPGGSWWRPPRRPCSPRSIACSAIPPVRRLAAALRGGGGATAAARHRRLAAALEDAYLRLLAAAPEPPP